MSTEAASLQEGLWERAASKERKRIGFGRKREPTGPVLRFLVPKKKCPEQVDALCYAYKWTYNCGRFPIDYDFSDINFDEVPAEAIVKIPADILPIMRKEIEENWWLAVLTIPAPTLWGRFMRWAEVNGRRAATFMQVVWFTVVFLSLVGAFHEDSPAFAALFVVPFWMLMPIADIPWLKVAPAPKGAWWLLVMMEAVYVMLLIFEVLVLVEVID